MSDLSATGLRLPRPRPYAEAPVPIPRPLDEYAARAFAYLKAAGSRFYTLRLAGIATAAGALEGEMRKLDDAALANRARTSANALRRSSGFPKAATAPCMAAVREIARRKLDRRPYDVQVIGAYAMLRGYLAQMATGEGKTLTAALTASIAALSGRPVHVVTVNDYLAARDAELMTPIYAMLGLSVGIVRDGMGFEERRAAYGCDITYCTNKELAFDYLRDRIVLGQHDGDLRLKLEALDTAKPARESKLRLHGLHFAIVDEADSVLVDEARTPLIISSQSAGQLSARTANEALALARSLAPQSHFHIVPAQRTVVLTPEGRERVRIYALEHGEAWRGVVLREEFARQALSAIHLFHRDEQYIVSEGKVQIVDEQTGRVMPDRAWSEGLHQMIEVKEGCEPTPRRTTLARLTYQRFFRRYRHLCGMTGTATHVARELWSVYRLAVAVVPTHRPRQRIDLPDRVLPDDRAKWRLVTGRVRELHAKDIPVLLGTRSVAASLMASEQLADAGLDHLVLNAAQDKSEAEIVALAGQAGRITVATNMAGRGTDIHLGPGVEERGGLHVIMVERHEARRIDDQLAGRSGRQGQPGCFQAILSLDDPLIEFAMLGTISRRLCRLWRPLLGEWPARRLLRHSQRRAERIHARMRRDLLKSDDNQSKALAFTGRPE